MSGGPFLLANQSFDNNEEFANHVFLLHAALLQPADFHLSVNEIFVVN